ncbi:MAG: hypothetical protein CMG08_03905 [Candidatus Marinimicrobia bacterium]|nr:hypothetical protein [Candidatus Neomarinimicrobiota bacterium]
MSLKSFHIFFVIISALLMVFMCNWALSNSMVLFFISVFSFFLLLYYGFNIFKKLNALPK